jgi:hypothetical protein
MNKQDIIKELETLAYVSNDRLYYIHKESYDALIERIKNDE